MRATLRLALVASFFLSPAVAAQAQTSYTLQSIIRLGDSAGGVPLQTTDGYFDMGTLNDSGQIIFSSADTATSEVLIQYSGGQFTPIVAGGKLTPEGRHWVQDIRLMPSVRMNQQGNAVFSAGVYVGGVPRFNSHLWDFQTQSIIPLIRPNTLASNDLVFVGTSLLPVINDNNEIALTAQLRSQAGTPTGDGVFFRDQSGNLTPIALPGQSLPGGGVIAEAGLPDLNNAGVVAFLARRQDAPANTWSAYQWSNGTVSALATVGNAIPGVGRITSVWSVWVDDANRGVLMELTTDSPDSGVGLYRFSSGQITPLAVPGQKLTGGDRLAFENGPSYANAPGQHAFLASLQDGSTAAYLIGPDGQLTRVLKSGDTTNLGRITNVGQGAGGSFGVGLNSRGQLSMTVSIEGGPDTLVVLTPAGA